jgi:hypothetical protein
MDYLTNKTIPICEIKKKHTTYIEKKSVDSEYSLKQNFFDPSKSSPPNEFMIKLNMRMNKYYFDNNAINVETK